jgi:hypothetical protein
MTLAMGSVGRAGARVDRANRGYYDPAPGRILRFGQLWKARGFTRGYWKCVSRSRALICTNASGHGWWLGRSRGLRLL